jgi:hypothetical protein
MKNLKVLALLMLLLPVFLVAAILAEPWNTVLFIVVIPLLHQLFKIYQDNSGKTIGKLGNQIISLVLAFIFMLLGGGFAGMKLPIFPVWGEDFIVFLGALIVFAGDWVVLIGVGWGSLMALYEAIWDKLFVAVGLATADKYL